MRELLPGVLARLARESGDVARLLPVWHEIVGAQIARNAIPRKLHGDVLVVEVTGARWAHELSQQQGTVCERLNARLGGSIIERLELVHDGGPR